MPDLVISGDDFSVWQGSGTGSFSKSTVISQTSPGTPVIGDFNGDGANDIAALNGGQLTVLFNDGQGHFPVSLAEVVPGNFAGSGFRSVDLNNDGLSDLVFTSPGASSCWNVPHECSSPSMGPSSVETLLSNGDGTFKSSYLPTTDPNAVNGAFQVLDINSDGAPDIVIATTNELVSLYYNQSATIGALVASNSTPYAGQTIQLTATVKSSLTNGLDPAGTVQYVEDGTVLGTATIASDVATFTTPALQTGTHIFSAIYQGDSLHSVNHFGKLSISVPVQQSTTLLVQ